MFLRNQTRSFPLLLYQGAKSGSWPCFVQPRARFASSLCRFGIARPLLPNPIGLQHAHCFCNFGVFSRASSASSVSTIFRSMRLLGGTWPLPRWPQAFRLGSTAESCNAVEDMPMVPACPDRLASVTTVSRHVGRLASSWLRNFQNE